MFHCLLFQMCIWYCWTAHCWRTYFFCNWSVLVFIQFILFWYEDYLVVVLCFLLRFLPLLDSKVALNCAVLSDCYEAFALHCFERYLIACLGICERLYSLFLFYSSSCKFPFNEYPFCLDVDWWTSCWNLAPGSVFCILFLSSFNSTSMDPYYIRSI